MKRAIASLAAAAVLIPAAALFGPATTHATSLQTDVPVAGVLTVVNPCNGDTVTATSGYLHAEAHGEANTGNAGIEINFQNVHAVGLTGDQYVVADNTHVVSAGNGGAFVDAFDVDLRYISQGSAPNFLAHVLVHTTINDNGVPTATIVSVNSECTG